MFASAAWAQESSLVIQTNQLTGAKQQRLNQLLNRHRARELKRLKQTDLTVVDAADSATLLNELRAAGIAVERDARAYLDATPNDPMMSQQWGSFDLGLPTVWDNATGSDSMIVGVVDTGFDMNHPDLQQKLWMNPGEDLNANGIVDPFEINGIDDDANGFVDDFHGADCRDNDGNPTFGFNEFHGTATAGLIGASTNNNVGISGAMWKVKLMVLRVFDHDGANLSDIAECINYARSMGAKVLNNSWSTNSDTAFMDQAINDYVNGGGVFVKSAGNDGVNCSDPFYSSNPVNLCFPDVPAGNNGMIVVAATNQLGDRASFSNWGATTAHVAAPGDFIQTTTLQSLGSYAAYSGTSFSAPLTAGVAGLMRSRNPGATPSQVVQALMSTVTPLAWAMPGGAFPLSTGGKVNAVAAVNAIGVGNQPPLITSIGSTVALGQRINIHAGDRADIDVVAIDPEAAGPLDYEWTLLSKPPTSQATLSGADTADTLLSPDVAGKYRLKVIVRDAAGASDFKLMTLDIGSILTDSPGNQNPSTVDQNPGNDEAISGHALSGADHFVSSSCGMAAFGSHNERENEMNAILLLLFISVGLTVTQRLKPFRTPAKQSNSPVSLHKRNSSADRRP